MRFCCDRHYGRLSAALFALSASTSVFADAGRLYLYPSAEYSTPASKLQAKDDYGFQFTGGATLSDRISLELLSDTQNYRLNSDTATLSQRGVSLQGLFMPFPELPIAPFISLGAGWLHSKFRGVTDDQPVARAGLGVQWYPFAVPLGLRADATVRHEFDNSASGISNTNDLIYNLGLMYRFGGHHAGPAVTQVPDSSYPAYPDDPRTVGPVPAPVKVAPASTVVTPAVAPPARAPVAEKAPQHPPLNGRPDADGDGITDELDKCPDTPPDAVVDADGCLMYLRAH